MATERRASQRFDVTELSFLSKPGESRAGLLIDISREGAKIEFIEPLTQVQHGFRAGDRVALAIDELGELTGEVARVTDKRVIVTFDADEVEKEMLAAEIQGAVRIARL